MGKREKFAKNAALRNANTAALKAGYNYGETDGTYAGSLPMAKAKFRLAPIANHWQ